MVLLMNDPYTINDLYLMFQKDYYGLKIHKTKYSKILRDVNMGLMDIVMDGHDVKLPHGLGDLVARARKMSTEKLMIDWGETNKLRKEHPDKNYKAYFTNMHTNGKVIRLLWFKMRSTFINKSYYRLDIAVPIKRKLAKRLKDSDIATEYYELETSKINKKKFWWFKEQYND